MFADHRLYPAQCRAARGLLGWTQEQLAEIAGVSRSTVRDFESGKHEIHRATRAQIIRAFEDASVQLIGLDEGQPGVQLVPPVGIARAAD